MKYLRDIETKQYMSSTRPTMNDMFEEHFGAKHSSGGEIEYDQLSLDDFDLSREFECVYKHFPDITLQLIRTNEWMIWYKGLNVTEEVYHNRTECLTNDSLRLIHRFVQDCTKTNNTFTVITETGIKIEHIGRIDYKKKSLHQNVRNSSNTSDYLDKRFDYMRQLQEKVIRKEFELRDKVANTESPEVSVIQTSLTFDSFFHPNKFVPIDKNLIIGQRDFIQLRRRRDLKNNWQVFVKDKLLFFDINVRDNNWDNVINDAALCKQIIHMFALSKAKGEFKFEALCDKCNNTKKLLQDTTEQTMWNGIPINIHQQQEISCTCNS